MQNKGRNAEIVQQMGIVRRRPGMYLGSTDDVGLHRMLEEVLVNAVDALGESPGAEIWVTLGPDGRTAVADNGPGIPVTEHEGRPFVERVLTELHVASRVHGPDKMKGGPHGFGLFVVVALSESLV